MCLQCTAENTRESDHVVYPVSYTHLTPVPVEHVKAPAIAESPVNIACRVVESHPLGSHTMFVAEVLGVTVEMCIRDSFKIFHLKDTSMRPIDFHYHAFHKILIFRKGNI